MKGTRRHTLGTSVPFNGVNMIIKEMKRGEFFARMKRILGISPNTYWPFVFGNPDYIDIGPVLCGRDLDFRVLVNSEAVYIMTGGMTHENPEETVRVLRRSLLRILNQLTAEPARGITRVEGSMAWFGRTVMVHHELDGKNPFIAIGAGI
jgi:hypothetical protein